MNGIDSRLSPKVAETFHLLRCELDTAFLHLDGVGFADTAHVLDTFPVVRKRNEATRGSYLTAQTLLNLHARLTAATQSSTPPPAPSNHRPPT